MFSVFQKAVVGELGAMVMVVGFLWPFFRVWKAWKVLSVEQAVLEQVERRGSWSFSDIFYGLFIVKLT